ncbi:MAG TPA: GNAT family N-acetyltransferase, partial [Pirellulaceae bacterium]
MAACEEYLQGRGARTLYVGAISPLNPFYLGLYGGSELPGVVRTDQNWIQVIRDRGYTPADTCLVFHCDLDRFKPPMDRQQLMLKRGYKVTPVGLPQDETWWQACTAPPHEPMRFELTPLAGDTPTASLQYWLLDPICRGWGVLAAGLTKLSVSIPHRRQGMGTLLVAESLRQIRMSGVQLVEAQTMERNVAAIALYRKLGFQEVDQGIVFRK